MYSSTQPSILEFSIIFLIFYNLLYSTLSANVVDQQYANCATFSSPCNPNVNISYPFWDSTRPAYCGHPEFKLQCQGDALTLQIKNQTYNVLNINYDLYKLTLLNPAFSQGPCPKTQSQLTNTTLDSQLFNFTSETRNVYLYYNCLKQNLTSIPPYIFSCQQSGGYDTPIITGFSSTTSFVDVEEKYESELTENCKIKVYAPVLNSSVQELISSNSTNAIDDVVSKGFEVNWLINESQCKGCSDSNGRCGFNQTFICLCPSGVQSKVCPQSDAMQGSAVSQGKNPGTRKFTVIGIGVAAAAGGVILLCILFFLYRRHYMQKKSSVNFLRQLSNTFSATLDPNASTFFGVHVFRYSELEEATEDFNPIKQLGEGGFGAVYYGKLHDGREVAVKRLYDSNRKRTEQFLNEVEILANLRHINLVTLYGCTSHQSKELLLVYEYVPNGTVADHLHGKKAKLSLLPWRTRLSIAIESADALVYLHEEDIIHRDVKTQNVLLDKNFSVKVADFGLSRLFPLDVTHVSTAPQGTPGYVDPEYYQCYHLTEKSDVYSFGVMLAELISSKPAVDVTRPRTEINLSNMLINKVQDHVLHEFFDPSLGFDTDFKVKKEMTAVGELAFQCLQSTRDMRPSMEQVLDRLYKIRHHVDKVDRPEVLDIPSDDVFMLKDELSPSSPRDDSLRQHIPNASV